MSAPVSAGYGPPAPVLREQMILQYVPLVRHAVGHFTSTVPAMLDSEDIYSYGTMGLIDAIDRFDASRGVKFETYAATRIRGYLQDQLRAMDWLPRSARTRVRTLQRATAQAEALLGRNPEWSEVVAASGMDQASCEQARVDSGCQMVSLEMVVTGDDEGDGPSLEQRLEDESSPNPALTTEEKELRAALAAALAGLPEREREIVELRYRRNWTLKQVAKHLGVSESRASQLHSQAVARLRRQLCPAFGDLLSA
jgi:RNA polymerase sigma factor FliA